MPSTVFVCSDNTPREAKNQYMLSYLVALTSKNLCRCTGLLNLRKSHSHDQVDQLWGILARRISSCDSLKSPQSVISTLESELARPGLKSWIGLQTATVVCKIDSVRDWKTHFAPQQVNISGGLKEDTTANHCFLMMQRRGSWRKKQCFEHICLHETLESLKDNIEFLKTRCTLRTDLPDQLQANIDRGASTAQADPHDTICWVKRYMGSESLSQRPLLIMTASRGDRVGLVPSTKLQSRKVSFQISFGFLRQTLGSEIFWA